MKNILKILFLFSIQIFNAQSFKQNTKDSLSHKYTANIEEVIINNKNYEKFEFSFSLKQTGNTRYIATPNYEMGMKFRNSTKRNGIVSKAIIFFHKTEPDVRLTKIELNFYKLDSITEQPLVKLNNQQIIYSAKNKNRGKVKINILDYNIPFPKEGVLMTVKWLPNESNDRVVGPSLRLTAYEEQLTYVRYKNNKWAKRDKLYLNPEKNSNVMMGLEAYIKKKK